MDSNDVRKPAEDHPDRVVAVDLPKFTELLVSRRKLERIGERQERLHDVETDEIFVMLPRSEAALAKGA